MAVELAVQTTKYAEVFCDWLAELGYTHCYFVAGGAMIHLLDGARKRFTCIPVVHEVAAAIAAEYHCEISARGRAFVLTTSGPGVTNTITGLANAWLESRELLVVSGQVKSSDLADGGIRQRGIQEVDSRSLAAPVSIVSRRIERPWSRREVFETVLSGRRGRPGPVFLEFCLDAQGAPVSPRGLEHEDVQTWAGPSVEDVVAGERAVEAIASELRRSDRPVLLIGGGVDRETATEARDALGLTGIPLATTWNGIDRVAYDAPNYVGRPNTWGQRAANIILHQSDCIVALGTRLGIQQTGFNWKEWAPAATVVQVDLDRSELEKGHPAIDLAIKGDANAVLRGLAASNYPSYAAWQAYCREIRDLLPVDEACNTTNPGYISPYTFYRQLSAIAGPNDTLIPSSSGGANFVAMQCLEQQRGQIIITDKGLASMGIALAGALGAAAACPERRTMLIDGDGGFLQNLQELATVRTNDLNLKIFIFSNEGYASIRSTQRNYFGGAYLGCDTKTGLGFPNWELLFDAFGIPYNKLDERGLVVPEISEMLDAPGPHAYLVPIDPEQTYFPKITSRMTSTGSMESNPLHLMTPRLPAALEERLFRFVPPEAQS